MGENHNPGNKVLHHHIEHQIKYIPLDFESTILALFVELSFIDKIFYFLSYVDSWRKILLFRTHHLWNSTTKLILLLTYIVYVPYEIKNNKCSFNNLSIDYRYLYRLISKDFKYSFWAGFRSQTQKPEKSLH